MVPPLNGVQKELAHFGVALDKNIPSKTATNLLIGTWNLRAFGGLTRSWESTRGDSPKRNWHAVACIAAVSSRFDVIAVQEVRRDVTALRTLMTMLGPTWKFMTSDVTEGSAGNSERLTFIYDTDRVQVSGLVGEIVLPPAADGPVEQFARTPYAAGFTRGEVDFLLTTVHVLWGASPAQRLPEITGFAQWMRDWADRPNDWNQNLFVLGDFNLDRIGNPLFEAFISTGLWPPTELNNVPRTIFDASGANHFYDQIAWFSEPDGTSLLESMTYTGRAGHFDFLPHLYPDLTRNEVSWRISDHYPLWAEFTI
ncbi:hypothetical protein GCM10009582_11150 [Arthrobacter flavus]